MLFKFEEKELKVIRKTAIFSVLGVAGIVAIMWMVEYNKIKEKNPDIKIKLNGQLVVMQDKITPIDREALSLSAQRFLETDQPAKAIPFLERLMQINPDNRLMQFRLASALLDAGNYESAHDEFARLSATDVQDSLSGKIFSRKGITLFYMKRLEESKSALHECLSRYPLEAEAYCYLGQIEASVRSPSKKAHSYLKKAIELDPSYIEGWYQLARFEMILKNFKAARTYLAEAIDREPLHVKSHSRLGMVYFYLGQTELARQSYTTALALNPQDFNTRYNLGELYYSSLSDTVSALKEFKETLQSNPRHTEANFKIGIICLANGMTKEAVRYFTSSLADNPDNIRTLLQLAVAYEKIGDYAKALEVYKHISSLDEINPIALHKIKLLSDK